MDPYKTLGIRQDADLEEVKRAYRRLVRKYHPDVCGRNMANVKRFLAIKDAYMMLKERLQQRAVACSSGLFFDSQAIGPGQLNRGSLEGAFYFVQISLKEALYGTTVSVEINTHQEFCPKCNGLGNIPDPKRRYCPHCHGKGYTRLNWGDRELKVICNKCSGKGYERMMRCPCCGGKGTITKRQRIEVIIPPGTKDGTVLELKGCSSKSLEKKFRGSCFVEVEVRTPDNWIVHGRDIISSVDIDCWSRLGGGHITIETIDGPEQVFITPGFSQNKFLRIKGRGWIDESGNRGDHIVRLNVLSPQGPCPKEAMELIQRLKRLWPCKNDILKALPPGSS